MRELNQNDKERVLQDYSRYIDIINNSINGVVDMNNKSDYEKRKIIFDTICEIHKFDYDNMYDKILYKFYQDNVSMFSRKSDSKDINNNFKDFFNNNSDVFKEKLISFLKGYGCYSKEILDILINRVNSDDFSIKFDVFDEAINLMTKQLISNGEADCIYKALLDKNGIYSLRVICDNGLPIEHGINIVYDSETGNYSFDDISSFLCRVGSKDDCFDYDLESCKKIGQGNRPPEMFASDCGEDGFGVMLNSYHNGLLVKDATKDEWYKSFGIEDGHNLFYQLPKNIKSVKRNNTK